MQKNDSIFPSELQLNLLDFEQIPEVAPTEKPKPKTRYYITSEYNGEWYFVWKTHTNGGAEWKHISQLTINGGRMKPLRYKTLNGARKSMIDYVGDIHVSHKPCKVEVWNDNSA